MKWSGPIGLLLTITLCVVHSKPTQTTTAATTTRSTQSAENSTKNVTNKQGNNTTTLDMMHDIRTPPRIKQQVQNKLKIKNEMENSHAGIAIPVDEDVLEMEETTKKLNFYKIERPTTNSGLSTWILLSGQASGATTKSPPTTKKPVIKPTPEEKQNVTVANDKPTRIIKPIFKQRPTTTSKPRTTTTTPTTTTVKSTTKLTKVKASALTNSNKKLNSTTESSTKKPSTPSSVTTVKSIFSTHLPVAKNTTAENSTLSAIESSALPLESKNGEVELPNTHNKKKNPTTKRKKNKNRRRKPGDKGSNSTSISKPTKNKEKPMGTQLYNYLAREIMPTVGVGLVGLMVTAGLASYFLYPFGVARRSYEVDRKDKEGSYYYNDDYYGGMPEEEAIGKVIAGMPGNSLFENSYKSPSSRNAYLNSKYRLTDRKSQIQRNPYGGMVPGTVENVPMTPMKLDNEKSSYQNNNYEPISYPTDLDSRFSPTVQDQKFVVGSISKETVTEVTPVAVPEHGPRNLNFEANYAEEPVFVVGSLPQEFTRNVKLDTIPAQRPRSLKVRRKRSDMPNDIDNEIVSNLDNEDVPITTTVYEIESTNTTTVTSSSNTTEKIETTTPGVQTTTGLPEKITSFIDLMKELIHLKARLGLQIIQNATNSISKYISKVQTRLDQQYRDYSKNKH